GHRGQARGDPRGRLRRDHRRLVRHPGRGCRRRQRPHAAADRPGHQVDPGHPTHRSLPLSQAHEADIQLGCPMTEMFDASGLNAKAHDHLWMHFTRISSYDHSPVPTIVRGEGAYIYDVNGKRYLDGLAGLFVVQAGHGRRELAEAAARQAEQLAYFPLWTYAHPQAIGLAGGLADYTPGDLNKVFFTTGGGEAVEPAWKMAKNYFRLAGKPRKAQGST